jgi:hypothetical protein
VDTDAAALPADFHYDFHVLAGDVNGDRTVNQQDLYLVWQNLLKAPAQRDLAHDLDGDGQVTIADVNIVQSHFLGALPVLGAFRPADINLDGIINDRDLLVVWQELLKPAALRNLIADVDHDGFVTNSDLNLVKNNYLISTPLPSPPAAPATPSRQEPSMSIAQSLPISAGAGTRSLLQTSSVPSDNSTRTEASVSSIRGSATTEARTPPDSETMDVSGVRVQLRGGDAWSISLLEALDQLPRSNPFANFLALRPHSPHRPFHAPTFTRPNPDDSSEREHDSG